MFHFNRSMELLSELSGICNNVSNENYRKSKAYCIYRDYFVRGDCLDIFFTVLFEKYTRPLELLLG